MKQLILCSLMASGMLFARGGHLSTYDRMALRTSSPPVHVKDASIKSRDMNKQGTNGYRVVTEKRTIIAYVPYGK